MSPFQAEDRISFSDSPAVVFGEGNGSPLQCSCLETPMDGVAWYWRRKWQPTPVLLPGESQGRGSLVGCRLWGRTESDTTDAT